MGNTIIMYGAIRALHDLASIIWIGSLIFISFYLIPKSKNITDIKNRLTFMNSIFDKLTLYILICIVILISTGILEHRFANNISIVQGKSLSNQYKIVHFIKYILTGIMFVIVILRQTMRKINKKKALLSKKKNPYVLIYTNTYIGIIIIFLSGFLSAIK